jgi:hypothetical protein
MKQRRGEFYIFQQHDDQVSPTYVADLVAEALRSPAAAVCFAEVQFTGQRSKVERGIPMSGPRLQRAVKYLETLDCVPFRGLIRSSALAATAGLLLSDFDPFDSFGTEMRLMAELALLGEFRFVPGPIYYKRMHGGNLHLKRLNWSDHQKQLAWACLAAWMVEVIVPAGQNRDECLHLFDMTLARFVDPDPRRWLKKLARQLTLTEARSLQPFGVLVNWIKSSDRLSRAASGRWMFYDPADGGSRANLVSLIVRRLQDAGRFDPSGSIGLTWEEVLTRSLAGAVPVTPA